MTANMTPENLDTLVRNACFAADNVAIDSRHLPGVQQTEAIVRRTIEFLIGNGLVEFIKDGSNEWLKIDPPYGDEL